MSSSPLKSYYLARWVFPISGPPIPHGFIAVEKEKIVEVGSTQDLPDIEKKQYCPESNTFMITPGLVNAHAHLEHSYSSKIPLKAFDDSHHLSMVDWLYKVVQLSRQNADTKFSRCEAGAHEMMRTGITCINDISSDGTSLSVMDALGLRGIVSLEFFHPSSENIDLNNLFSSYQRLQEQYGNHPALKIGLSPHSPYNVSPAAWQKALELCQPTVVHTHVSESEIEHQWIEEGESALSQLHEKVLGRRFRPQILGLSPIEYLQYFGLLDKRLIAAHGVYADEHDRQLIAHAGVSLAHCPRSNLYLAQNTIKWEDWESLDISIALGTDSRLSTDCLDIRQEAREAMRIHRLSSQEGLKRITLSGASVMGLDGAIGSLSPGKIADFVLWDGAKLDSLQIIDNPEALVLDKRTQLDSLYIQGKKRSIEATLPH